MLALNNNQLSLERYYGGELRAVYSGMKQHNQLLWLCDELNTEAELFFLQALMASLHDEGYSANLLMPYIPYSRNDHANRAIGQTGRFYANTLKALATVINSCRFNTVTVCEPHSDVAPALLDRCRVISIVDELLDKALADIGSTHRVALIFPDGGAEKRYMHMPIFAERACFSATKARDPVTNAFTSFKLDGDFALYDTAIIVDDLCSAGGTFTLAAEALRERGIRDIYLAVSHCENNIKNGKILTRDLIKCVYTSDSILTLRHPKIKIAHEFAKEGIT